MERKFRSMGRVRSREVLLAGAIPAFRTKGGGGRAGAGVEAKRKRTAEESGIQQVSIFDFSW